MIRKAVEALIKSRWGACADTPGRYLTLNNVYAIYLDDDYLVVDRDRDPDGSFESIEEIAKIRYADPDLLKKIVEVVGDD